MSLGQFHANTPSPAMSGTGDGATASQPSQIVRMNWADEMDKLDDSARTLNLFKITSLSLQIVFHFAFRI